MFTVRQLREKLSNLPESVQDLEIVACVNSEDVPPNGATANNDRSIDSVDGSYYSKARYNCDSNAPDVIVLWLDSK